MLICSIFYDWTIFLPNTYTQLLIVFDITTSKYAELFYSGLPSIVITDRLSAKKNEDHLNI